MYDGMPSSLLNFSTYVGFFKDLAVLVLHNRNHITVLLQALTCPWNHIVVARGFLWMVRTACGVSSLDGCLLRDCKSSPVLVLYAG